MTETRRSRRRQASLWEDQRLTLAGAIDLTAASLRAYGAAYRHWCVAYSGGKDSTATVTLVAHLLATGAVPAPETLTILYADTGMELPPLHLSALAILAALRERGVATRVVRPPLDRRFFVYMLGRGVPPPRPGFRWCTGALKVDPMAGAMAGLRAAAGDKLLLLTGVRLGESAVRDGRIAVACSKDGAECGQGYFQREPPKAATDVLAPIVHWRVCHVWDWLTFDAPALGFPTADIAEVYGGDEKEEINARTGCVACNVATRETNLDTLLALPQWAYLAPFRRLRPLYAELVRPHHRLRKNGQERYSDGRLFRNPTRLGPLLLDSRRWGLGEVLRIQSDIGEAARARGRPEVALIDAEELARIEELIAAETWPDGWDGSELHGDDVVDLVRGEGVVQPLLNELRSAWP